MAEIASIGLQGAALGADIAAIETEAKAAKVVADYNAQVSRASGRQALERRIDEAKFFRRRAQRIRSMNIAKGAPLAVLEENELNAELDALNILRQGSIEASQFDARAALDEFEGKIVRQGAKMKKTGALIGGVAQLTRSSFNFAGIGDATI